MDRKIIARFPSLLEAEAAVSCLLAGGVAAAIDNLMVASMMPHASNAFGGFIVSIPSEDEESARELLAGIKNEDQPEPVSTESPERKFKLTMRKATYGAVMGAFLLPVIANIYSLIRYRDAHELNPKLFWSSWPHLLIGAFFNLFGLGLGCVAALSYFGLGP